MDHWVEMRDTFVSDDDNCQRAMVCAFFVTQALEAYEDVIRPLNDAIHGPLDAHRDIQHLAFLMVEKKRAEDEFLENFREIQQCLPSVRRVLTYMEWFAANAGKVPTVSETLRCCLSTMDAVRALLEMLELVVSFETVRALYEECCIREAQEERTPISRIHDYYDDVRGWSDSDDYYHFRDSFPEAAEAVARVNVVARLPFSRKAEAHVFRLPEVRGLIRQHVMRR
jgi:hypothetical protein